MWTNPNACSRMERLDFPGGGTKNTLPSLHKVGKLKISTWKTGNQFVISYINVIWQLLWFLGGRMHCNLIRKLQFSHTNWDRYRSLSQSRCRWSMSVSMNGPLFQRVIITARNWRLGHVFRPVLSTGMGGGCYDVTSCYEQHPNALGTAQHPSPPPSPDSTFPHYTGKVGDMHHTRMLSYLITLGVLSLEVNLRNI